MFSKIYNLLVLIRSILLDGMVTLLPHAKCNQDGKIYVLIIKLFAIGDFVLWLDVAAELRKLYPPESYRLVLLGNAIWTDLAQQLPYFDEVIPVDRKRLYYDVRYRLKMWISLRKRAWAAAVSSDYSRDLLYGDAVVRMSAAKERIGFQGDLSNQFAWQKCISNRWYTRLIPASDQPLMELERNAEFIRGLGVLDFKAKSPQLDIPDVLPENFVVKDYFVVVPGAGVSIRQWPLEFFAEIATRIKNEFGLTPVICGAPGEEMLGVQLRQQLNGSVEDWTGKTSMTELVSIIRGARLVLGNESGAMHIAAAVETPAFCITGGGHWGRFVPYHMETTATGPLPVPIVHHMDCFCCNWKCNFKVADGRPVRCIEQVSIDDVWSAITEQRQIEHRL
jgi:ADP-heptose:LPS heptosyltransferase